MAHVSKGTPERNKHLKRKQPGIRDSDLWFEKRIKGKLRGEVHLYRYADDFVVCFQRKDDAELFGWMLRDRLGKFALELAEEKTRLVGFGRFEAENARRQGRKPGSFVFLGFRHVCGKSRRGYFKVKRHTSKDRLRRGLLKLDDWLDKHKATLRKRELIEGTRRRVQGHLVHFGITDNLSSCSTFLFLANQRLFKALNRKSQRKAYTWEGFGDVLKHSSPMNPMA